MRLVESGSEALRNLPQREQGRSLPRVVEGFFHRDLLRQQKSLPPVSKLFLRTRHFFPVRRLILLPNTNIRWKSLRSGWSGMIRLALSLLEITTTKSRQGRRRSNSVIRRVGLFVTAMVWLLIHLEAGLSQMRISSSSLSWLAVSRGIHTETEGRERVPIRPGGRGFRDPNLVIPVRGCSRA